MYKVDLAFIGGSGLYQIKGAELISQAEISTPFGSPSDLISICDFNGRKVAFLPRHGRGHHLLPSDIPYLANIFALKKLGVNKIVAFNAVGSLQEAFKPGDFVIPNQLIDRTYLRRQTFFGSGLVGHIPFADPFCPELAERVFNLVEKYLPHGKRVINKAVCLVMEGPAFSTRAESELYRSWNCDIIGMTALPEAKLAREAAIAYAAIGMVTDYDCWHKSEEDVNIESVLKIIENNTTAAQAIVRGIAGQLPRKINSIAYTAASNVIISDRSNLSEQAKADFSEIFGSIF